MDTELKFEEIQFYDLLVKTVTTHEESTETTLPDYCATMSRVLDATGQLLVREKQAAEGLLRGDVRVSVLYLSEEADGLQSVTIMVPFTCELSDPMLRDCRMLQVHSRLLLCEAKPITGRKMYIRVIPELTVYGFGPKSIRVCSGAEGKGLQVRRICQEVSLLVAAEERSCTTAQEFSLEGSGAEDILLSSVFPRVISCQQIGSKLVVKGEIDVSALVRTMERKLQCAVQTVPFSQILDGIAVPADCAVQVEAQLSEWDLRLVRSENGCRLGLTARITLEIFAYQKREVCYISDLYSTCNTIKIQTTTVCISQRSLPLRVREWDEEQLESGRGALFAYVTAFDCGSASLRCDNGRADLSTTARMRILYQDENDTPITAERSQELSAAADVCPESVFVDNGMPILRGNSGSCQVRVPVNFYGIISNGLEIHTIAAIEEVEEEDAQRKPSLVLRRPRAGECLWDIAKQHSSSEDAIRQYNHIDGETIPDGMLLIPSIRS